MNIGGVNRNTNAHIPGPIMSQHRSACCDNADPHGVRVGKSAQEPRGRDHWMDGELRTWRGARIKLICRVAGCFAVWMLGSLKYSVG